MYVANMYTAKADVGHSANDLVLLRIRLRNGTLNCALTQLRQLRARGEQGCEPEPWLASCPELIHAGRLDLQQEGVDGNSGLQSVSVISIRWYIAHSSRGQEYLQPELDVGV